MKTRGGPDVFQAPHHGPDVFGKGRETADAFVQHGVLFNKCMYATPQPSAVHETIIFAVRISSPFARPTQLSTLLALCYSALGRRGNECNGFYFLVSL